MSSVVAPYIHDVGPLQTHSGTVIVPMSDRPGRLAGLAYDIIPRLSPPLSQAAA
jgi:hypothetical protein